jgi:succinate dehydrogenase / fumarate reductase membrane anchor subunit
MKPSTDLRSKLARARGLGSAHHGVEHWWWQRVTAAALVPLAVWFLYALITNMLSPDVSHVHIWLATPFNALATILMLVAGLFHAKLGAQVVIEDYIKPPHFKYPLLLLNTFVCGIFAVIGIVAVLKLHFLDIAAGSL